MQDKLVLTYFNATGRAELAKWIMAQGNIEFEDRRITLEEWAALKPKTPNGQLPILEVKGTMICQSHAIAHYLAKRAGLCGKDDLEAARAEMIVLSIEDVVQKFMPIISKRDEEETDKLVEIAMTEILPRFVKNLESILTNNGGEYFVGNQLSWPHIAVAAFFGPDGINKYLNHFDLKILSSILHQHVMKILAQPKIKSWTEKNSSIC